jgi:4-aminobutyrate aminotransferase-like enzyme
MVSRQLVTREEDVLQLDDNLKHLMKELGAAINDALSESEEISEAIQNVRNAGYDVFLVLEATIGFNRRKADGTEEISASGLKSGDMKLKVTAQDLKFLRSLKISVEDLDQQQ